MRIQYRAITVCVLAAGFVDPSRATLSAQGLTAAAPSDGTFNATAAPWATPDGTTRADIARFSGKAIAIVTGPSFVVLLCGDSAAAGFMSSMSISLKPGSAAVPQIDTTFSLPDRGAYLTVAGQGVIMVAPASGSIRLSTGGQQSLTGEGQIRFAVARVAGATKPEPVEVAMSFKATIADPKGPRPSCAPSRPKRPTL